MENKVLQTCETCGGTLIYAAYKKSAVCSFCGNEYFFKEEKSEALTLALNRANALRLRNDFDGAIAEYKLVAERNPDDAEAFWGLALSTYGIEYVEDPRTRKRVPTCRRTVKKSILEDENYIKALENAPAEQREIYERRAAVIDRLQKSIKRRLEDEEDFDVFISFKSTDEEGKPTKERGVARRIYDELERRGIKTFFSEVTLRDRIGEDFEPIIFKALYSCKFFILVAASEENMNSAWVKNEWSRYRDRVFDENLSGAGCAVFEGMSPNALPAFLRTQGINLAKYPAGGYEIEIADALAAKFGLTHKNDEAEEIRRQIEEQKKAFEEQQRALEERLKNVAATAAPATGASATINSLLLRAKQETESGDYGAAQNYYNKVLDADPTNSEAWLGLFFCENKTTEKRGLVFAKLCGNAEEFYNSVAENERRCSTMKNKNFSNAKKYADSAQSKKLTCLENAYCELAEKTRNGMAARLTESGVKAVENGAYSKALTLIDAALSVYPKLAPLWLTRALAEIEVPVFSQIIDDCTLERYKKICNSESLKNAYVFADGEFKGELTRNFTVLEKVVAEYRVETEADIVRIKKTIQQCNDNLQDLRAKRINLLNMPEDKRTFGKRVYIASIVALCIALPLSWVSYVVSVVENYDVPQDGLGLTVLITLLGLIISAVIVKKKKKEVARIILENEQRKKNKESYEKENATLKQLSEYSEYLEQRLNEQEIYNQKLNFD